MLLAGCWAHARRGFFEALDQAPKEAGWVLIQIAHLYDIERKLRRQRAGPALRDAYRTSQSAPICRRIHRILLRWQFTRRFLPKSTMGQALSYALSQWEALQVYLQEPHIEIDNNLVENAIRPLLLERRTGYFSVTPKPANAAPSFTRSSKAADATALSPILICTTCCSACPP